MIYESFLVIARTDPAWNRIVDRGRIGRCHSTNASKRNEVGRSGFDGRVLSTHPTSAFTLFYVVNSGFTWLT